MEDFSKSGKLPFAVMPSSNIKYAWRYSPAFYLSTLPCTVVVLTTQMFVFYLLAHKRAHTKLAHTHTPFSSSYVFYPRYFIDFGVSVSVVWWCFQVLQCSSEFHSWLEYRWVLTGTHHDENRSGHFHNFTLFPFF